jgi:hypothetical protein
MPLSNIWLLQVQGLEEHGPQREVGVRVVISLQLG